MTTLYNINLNFTGQNSEFMKSVKKTARIRCLKAYAKLSKDPITAEHSFSYRPTGEDAQKTYMDTFLWDASKDDSVILFHSLHDVCSDNYKAVRMLDYWIKRAKKMNHVMHIFLYGYTPDADYTEYRTEFYKYLLEKHGAIENQRNQKVPYPEKVLNYCVRLRAYENPPVVFQDLTKYSGLSKDTINSTRATNDIECVYTRGRRITESEIEKMQALVKDYRDAVMSKIEVFYDD